MLNKIFNKIVALGLVIIILIVTLSITFFILIYTQAAVKNSISLEFDTNIKDIEYALQTRINTYNNILYAMQGFFAASDNVERREWAPFVTVAKINQYPDINFISFIQIIPGNEKEIFSAQFIKDNSIHIGGYPDFKIYPEGKRDEYAILKYAYPESENAIKAYGFDLYADPVRNAVLKEARDFDALVASKIISIIPDQSIGFIIVAPIYRGNVPHSTLQERRTAIVGYVDAVFEIKTLFSTAIFNNQNGQANIAFAIYDSTDGGPLDDSRLVYANDKSKFTPGYKPAFQQTKTIEIDKRTWTIKFSSMPGFGYSFAHRVLPWVVGLGGASLSFLITAVFYVQSKKAREELTTSEINYRRLFESIQDGILILDLPSKKIINANPFIKKMLGYSRKEILGKDIWEIGIFKDINTFNNCFTYLESKGFIHCEMPMRKKSGDIIDVELISNVYETDHKKVIHFNIRDVSKRKKAEEIMKIRNKKLKKLNRIQENTKKAMLNIMSHLKAVKSKVEMEKSKAEAMLISIGEGVTATDSKGIIIAMNKSAENMLNFKPGEMIGKKFTEACPIEDNNGYILPSQKRPIELTLTDGKTINTNAYWFVRQDKTRFPVSLTVAPIILAGKIIGAINVFKDITKEKEIDKAKTEFVSLASHQLRTPLSTINWYINSILAGDLGKINLKQKSYLNEIYKSNQRMVDLINALLNVSRIEMGTLAIEPVASNLTKLANRALEDLQFKIKEKNLQITKNYDSALPLVPVDPKMILIVFQNIFSNAIQYTPASGKIQITLKKQKPDVLITVSDTGCGIPREQQPKIFTKLFRADNAREIETSGSGLGLYITKAIVGESNGKIWFESEENNGTTFYVTIPLNGIKKKRGTKQLIPMLTKLN